MTVQWPTIGPYQEYPEGPEIHIVEPTQALNWAIEQKKIIQPLAEAIAHFGLGMGIAANSWLQQLNQIIDVSNDLRDAGPDAEILVKNLKNLFKGLKIGDSVLFCHHDGAIRAGVMR